MSTLIQGGSVRVQIILSRKINPGALFGQPFRRRHVPDPGTLEQRLFRAITKPVIPEIKITASERRIRRMEERRIREENNPYRKFLIQKAREEFYAQANGRMLLILHALYHRPRDFIAIRNRLFAQNLVFHRFPVSILRDAAVGTRWEVFAKYVLNTDVPNLYLFGDLDPALCRDALAILRTAPFLLPIGGVVDYRIMTLQQVQDFAGLSNTGGIAGLHSKLAHILERASGQDLLRSLTSHQSDLIFGLRQHSSAS
ncbi:unnamed protein product [Calicophoron daubneyi]|uniref:Large ribosomal subunit protein uL10m n=1 Tax=Calicophoron daubneyi TaxID=300641 RepID=A0AAV2T0S3_CALDB